MAARTSEDFMMGSSATGTVTPSRSFAEHRVDRYRQFQPYLQSRPSFQLRRLPLFLRFRLWPP